MSDGDVGRQLKFLGWSADRLVGRGDMRSPRARVTAMNEACTRIASPARAVRVLVAEDNTVNQKVVRGQLEKLGCSVDVVSNGLEAIEAVERGAYDVVFLDCQMPVMDGYEAATRLRAMRREGDPSLPVVAMTASVVGGERERCLAAGMDDYVSKPIDVEELGRLVGRWTDSASAAEPVDPRAATREVVGILDLLDEFGPDFVRDIVDEYLKTAGATCATARAAAAEGDAAKLKRAGHAIKGSSVTVGAPAVAALGDRLELEAAALDVAAAGALIARIEAEVARVRDAAATALRGAAS